MDLPSSLYSRHGSASPQSNRPVATATHPPILTPFFVAFFPKFCHAVFFSFVSAALAALTSCHFSFFFFLFSFSLSSTSTVLRLMPDAVDGSSVPAGRNRLAGSVVGVFHPLKTIVYSGASAEPDTTVTLAEYLNPTRQSADMAGIWLDICARTHHLPSLYLAITSSPALKFLLFDAADSFVLPFEERFDVPDAAVACVCGFAGVCCETPRASLVRAMISSSSTLRAVSSALAGSASRAMDTCDNWNW